MAKQEVRSCLVVLYAVLDVDEAHNFELPGQLGGPVADNIQTLLRNGLRWYRASRISCIRKIIFLVKIISCASFQRNESKALKGIPPSLGKTLSQQALLSGGGFKANMCLDGDREQPEGVAMCDLSSSKWLALDTLEIIAKAE